MKDYVYIIKTPPFWLKTAPLSLIYLKNYLKKYKIPVRVIDLNMQTFKLLGAELRQWLTLNHNFENNLFAIIEKKYPDFLKSLYASLTNASIVAFSLFKRNSSFAFSLAARIKEKCPNKKIVFGGPEVFFLERIKKLDERYHWVIGEGELPLRNIISNGAAKTFRFKELDDLDTLPLYDFRALPPKNYSSCIPLLSSRGCPGACSFCSERLLYKKFRHHSPQYMIDQIIHLKKIHKANNFVFCDSLINYKQDWLHDFCKLAIDKKIGIKWEAQMRIEENFPLSLAQLMKKSGCYNLFIGLESGSDRLLNLINKGFTAQCARNFFKTLAKARLHFEVSLIFGHPNETDADFLETLNFITKNKSVIPKIAQANPFLDYLGTWKNELPTTQAKERVQTFLQTLEVSQIKYTKSFINNLIY